MHRRSEHLSCFAPRLHGCWTVSCKSPSKDRTMRIGLLDHMGYGNLGDAATQEALIANIRSRVPDAEVIGFSFNTHDTQKRHNIVSNSITPWHPGLKTDETTAGSEKSK